MPLIQQGGEFRVSNTPDIAAQKQAQQAEMALLLQLLLAAARPPAPMGGSGNVGQNFLTLLGSDAGGNGTQGFRLGGGQPLPLSQALQRLAGSLLRAIGLPPGLSPGPSPPAPQSVPLGLPPLPSVDLSPILAQSPFFGGLPSDSDLAILTGTLPTTPGASLFFGGPLQPDDLSQLTGTSPSNLLQGIGTPGQLLTLPSTLSTGAGDAATLAATLGAADSGEFGLNVPSAAPSPGFLGTGNLLPAIGTLASIGSGIFNLTQGNIPAGASSLGGTALGAAVGSLVPGIGTLLGASIGGGTAGLLGSLLGGGFGRPSIFDARRANVGPTVAAGQSALAQGIQQGAKTGTLDALMAGLGTPTPDTFGAPRQPTAVLLDGFNFNPARGQPVTPQMFSSFLDEVRGQIPAWQAGEKVRQADFARQVMARQEAQTAFDQQVKDFLLSPDGKLSRGEIEVGTGQEKDATLGLPRGWIRPPDLPALPPSFPAALNRITGSGDVAFQEQGASEALAASVADTARQGILDFLLAHPATTVGLQEGRPPSRGQEGIPDQAASSPLSAPTPLEEILPRPTGPSLFQPFAGGPGTFEPLPISPALPASAILEPTGPLPHTLIGPSTFEPLPTSPVSPPPSAFAEPVPSHLAPSEAISPIGPATFEPLFTPPPVEIVIPRQGGEPLPISPALPALAALDWLPQFRGFADEFFTDSGILRSLNVGGS